MKLKVELLESLHDIFGIIVCVGTPLVGAPTIIYFEQFYDSIYDPVTRSNPNQTRSTHRHYH
jgi:hypothetical protein